MLEINNYLYSDFMDIEKVIDRVSREIHFGALGRMVFQSNYEISRINEQRSTTLTVRTYCAVSTWFPSS